MEIKSEREIELTVHPNSEILINEISNCLDDLEDILKVETNSDPKNILCSKLFNIICR